MRLKISVLIFFITFVSCQKETPNKKKASTINYLIEVEELLKIAEEPNIKILDFRKAEFYKNEHIEGALNIWRTDIEDASYPYIGMMASKSQIEKLFSNLGIENGDTIVIYDDNGLCDSARLWWILQNYDYTKVKLLHGGIKVWKNKNGKVTKDTTLIKKSSFKLPNNPSLRYYLSKEEMLTSVNNKSIIIDTRTIDEYSGKRRKKGAFKGGRIPKSSFIDWANAIDYHGNKKIKPLQELEPIYKKFIPSKNDTVMIYCHSGVRSAHTTFVLTQLLGYKNVKNYDGSWTEWSYFNDLPFEKDSITTITK